MAERSAISWTRSTFNGWIGCTNIGPGCDACYAEALDKRHRWGGDTHWGDDKPRYRTSPSNWAKPIQWNKEAEIEKQTGVVAKGDWHTPGFWPVFCASLADVFDNRVPDQWQMDLWKLIEDTPNLSWLLVTKRIGNVKYMVPSWWLNGFPPQVRILITVVNQAEADRDITKLLALNCKNGVSYEPALGPVDWLRWLGPQCDHGSVPAPGGGAPCPRCLGNTGSFSCHGIEWIIVGGESNQGAHKARPFHVDWARSTIKQCQDAGVPVFVKQLGSYALRSPHPYDRLSTHDKAGADPEYWPADLRVQEFPT